MKKMKIGGKVIRVAECTSTNDLAKKWVLENAEEGTVIISNKQTQGRGTKGREWFSPDSQGLYLSVILQPRKKNISFLSLVGGIAAADAIFEAEKIRISLKWPNDLVWKDRKLGGILSESSFIGNQISHVILGLGLNISQKGEDFPESLGSSSISLRMITKREVDKDVLLKSLWKHLNLWYDRFLDGREMDIIRAFEALSALSVGDKISLRTKKGDVTGVYGGLDESGGLILKTQGQAQSFFSAQIKALQRSQEE